MYAGLRRGELMGLRIEDVEFERGLIHVRRGWDTLEGEITPKSGRERAVPINGTLRAILEPHIRGLPWSAGLVFGVNANSTFNGTPLMKRAARAWEATNLRRITLHECRHTFASLMIAAGVNAKALSTYMGHATISITLDRYGHLMPGSEHEAAQMLDEYLARNAPGSRQSNGHGPEPSTPEALTETALAPVSDLANGRKRSPRAAAGSTAAGVRAPA
jgi:integrase